MPAGTIETERLRLVPWSPSDDALLARLAAMPEMVRHVGDGSVWPPDHVALVADRIAAHWRAFGFGWRVAVLCSTGAPVGFLALNFIREGTPGVAVTEYEIGWWIDPAFQGYGYAREGATGMLDEALGRLGAPGVVARIQPANAASRAVAEAIGLRWEFDTVVEPNIPCAVYRGPVGGRSDLPSA